MMDTSVISYKTSGQIGAAKGIGWTALRISSVEYAAPQGSLRWDLICRVWSHSFLPQHFYSDSLSIDFLSHWACLSLSQNLSSFSVLLSLFCCIQSLSRVWLFLTPWTAAHQASLSFTFSQSLFKLMSIKSVVPSNQLILCCPFLLLPSIFPSNRVFSSDSAPCLRWPKDWSFSFSISPSNEYIGLISFKIDWFDLLAVQRLSKVFSSTAIQFHTQLSL